MTDRAAAASGRRRLPAALRRRFEAIVFGWDGIAVAGRESDAMRIRRLVEEACAAGLELAIISSRCVDEVDGQLAARPADPATLTLLLNHGSEVFRVGRAGPQLVARRTATDKSDSSRWFMRELWRRGIAPGQVLIAGDEFGTLGGSAGSDTKLLVGRACRATAMSVGVEPAGVPTGVIALGGGPDAFAAVLEDQIARRQRREVPTIDPDRAWTLAVDGVDPLLERVHESLLTLADGRLGTRGSVVVTHPTDAPSVLLAGIYTGMGPETELLAAPRWNAVCVAGAHAPAVHRVLDLHAGVLRQDLQSGDRQLEALLLSSLARPATTALRIRDRGFGLSAAQGLQQPSDAPPQSGSVDGDSWMRVSGPPGSVAAAANENVSGPAGDRVLDRIASYEGNPDAVADERRALRTLARARQVGFDGLLGEHRRAWAARWQDADVRIDGDLELQLAVRLALFHLMASVGGEGESAVGARGLTGGAYRGHVFWDSDVYVLPFLAATHPQAARAMLEYRLRRLPAALHAARAQGRVGARFAWESAASGEDVTPRARDRRGQLTPVLTGELEEHIVADVAWAAAHYADWTGDHAFVAGPGREMLVHTARWWAARIELDDDGAGHICGVIGPDEYHEHVDDNAYTNIMARWNLRRAANATADGTIDAHERHRWLDLADALTDGYDPTTGLYEQFAGFFALEPLIVAEIAPRRPVAAELLLGAARTHAAQVVKQADVLMAHYVVPDEVAADSLEPNLDFYEPRTAHGSTLSPGVHATLLARAGRLDQALQLLRLTARIDLDDIGQTTAGGLHLAAMGSLWRALAFGFGGLRPAEGSLVIDPIAVPGVAALELRVRFRDSRVRLRITPDGAEVSATPPITVLAPGLGLVEVGPTARRFDLSPRPERTT